MAELPKVKQNASRSLADLQLNTILAAEHGISSGDEEAEAEAPDDQVDDARGTVGISIGKQQTRLTSPRTPAIEKAAAIDHAGGFFGFGDGTDGASKTGVLLEDDDEDADHEPLKEPGQATPSIRLPSPDRSRAKESEPPRGARSVLRDAFSFNRLRASSDPDAKDSDRSRPSVWSSLPSIGRHLPFSASREAIEATDNKPDDGATQQYLNKRSQLGTSGSTDALKATEEAEATVDDDLPTEQELNSIKSRPSNLRRSTSDTSLVMRRTMSRVSSLGDDSRFADVHEQVNSRFKAIKDSFQDSNLRLPSISSLTPDFLRDRSNSASAKTIDNAKGAKKPVDPMTRQPYRSAKFALQDAPVDKNAATHPHFTKAMDQLQGDLVILGGYRGSILRSAEPPHRQLWVPIKVGLNLRKVDLEVGLQDEDDERATESIIPGGMLTHIGPVDISRRLFKRLRTCDNARSEKLRVHDYGYDWRLHPLHLSKQLIAFLESLPCNQPSTPKADRGALVVAHSLGGLITRHAVNQRPELFRGVVYAGVPKTCVNILGPLRNGDEVLLSSRVLTAQVNFTIRTSFALLPLNGRCFFDKNTKEEYRVDFFDPQTWVDYRLSPCVARPLPPLATPSRPSGISGYVSSVAHSIPLRGRRATLVKSKPMADPANATVAGGVAEPEMQSSAQRESDVAVAHGNIDQHATNSNDLPAGSSEEPIPPSVRTAVTLPHDAAMEYLTRTLRTVKRFKQELAFVPAHHSANVYPPIAVIYGKTTPTVFGAQVDGREGIKHADAYDDLSFASGDGVVLARAAMVPEGYHTAKHGIVSSERGHVTLLGDLEAVGKCLNAVMDERKRGVGSGKP